MKKIILICVLVAAVFSACGQDKHESEFKKTINERLEQQYACLNFYTEYFVPPSGFGYNLLNHYQNNKNNFAIVIETKRNGQLDKLTDLEKNNLLKLDALVKVGLLKKSRKTKFGVKATQNLTENVLFIINIYRLTDEGKKAIHENKNQYDQPVKSLCYAHTQVDRILNVSEEKVDGQDLMKIKYRYRYVDVADWTDNKDIKTVFPEINKILNASDATSKITLIKTNNGFIKSDHSI